MSVKGDDRRESKVNVDKLLVDEIGQFGKFQIKIFAQCLFCVVFAAWNINEFVFTAARIPTRCMIPECENVSSVAWSPAWISHAVPSSDGVVDSCRRFGTSSLSEGHYPSCPSTMFNTSVLQQCEQYVYENTNTLVYDFELACQEWKRALVGTVRLCGKMVALAITGYISDRWGRRRALALNAFNAAVVGVLRYWAPNYTIYVLLLFIESAMSTGSVSCVYVITMELVGPKYRFLGGALINTTFASGVIILSLLAWTLTDWRNLILTLYIPQFITILYFWTVTESVRWLMNKGRFEESENILKQAATANGKQLSQKSLDDLRRNAMEEKANAENKDRPSLMMTVLKDRRMTKRCIATCMWFGSGTLVYYGLSINAVHLTGNMYLNYIAVIAVEIPGYLSVVLFVDKIGRKPTIISAFWLCAASQIAFIFIPKDATTTSLIVYLIGKWAIAVALTAMNICTIELYPTECRHRMYNFSSVIGRIGSMIAPLTPALAVTLFAELPFVLFCGMALLAGLVTFLVPETLDRRLPDTMEEALGEQLNKNKVKSNNSNTH